MATALRELEGRTAIVTGAAGGLGRAIAHELAAAGATVVAVDRDGEGVEAAVSELQAAGATCLAHVADVALAAGAEGYVEATLDRFGRVDILCNNAGIEGSINSIVDQDQAGFERVLAVNLGSVFLGMRAVLPRMIAAGAGSIVNVSSTAGLNGPAGQGAYAASKHAVIGITRVAAAENAPHAIRVNAICPGPTDTRMMRSIERDISPDAPEEAARMIASMVPLGRYSTPEDQARVVRFLASDAAAFVTGAAWAVDGGMTAVPGTAFGPAD
jgi:NAD(P)-dependent dehydrogenase (short-subunit alcohol dehydrogenase family)